MYLMISAALTEPYEHTAVTADLCEFLEQRLKAKGDQQAAAEALQEYNAKTVEPDHLGAVVGSLDSPEIDAFVQVAIRLGCASRPTPAAVLAAWDQRQKAHNLLRIQSAQIEQLRSDSETLLRTCQARLAELQNAKKEFGGWGRRELELSTRETGAATQMLKAKRAEYEERLARLRSAWADLGQVTTFSSLQHNFETIKQRQADLAKVEAELLPYNQLPPNLSLARIEIEKARQELDRLLASRDSLLRKLS